MESETEIGALRLVIGREGVVKSKIRQRCPIESSTSQSAGKGPIVSRSFISDITDSWSSKNGLISAAVEVLIVALSCRDARVVVV